MNDLEKLLTNYNKNERDTNDFNLLKEIYQNNNKDMNISMTDIIYANYYEEEINQIRDLAFNMIYDDSISMISGSIEVLLSKKSEDYIRKNYEAYADDIMEQLKDVYEESSAYFGYLETKNDVYILSVIKRRLYVNLYRLLKYFKAGEITEENIENILEDIIINTRTKESEKIENLIDSISAERNDN